MKKKNSLIIGFLMLFLMGLTLQPHQCHAASNFTISIPKTKSVYLGHSFSLVPKMYLNGKKVSCCDSIKWSYSDKKSFSKLSEDIYDEYPYLFAEKIGKCKVTVKVIYYDEYYDDYLDDFIDKKYTATASCTVTVKPPKNLQVSASLDSYNTRSNEFILSLKNYTGKTIRIYSNGSWVREDDYRFYDRNLKLSNGKSYIDIKPMKKATIKFKVKGRLTWYRVSDFTLFSKWKWNGKVYDTKVSYFGAYIKTGNKWKNMSVF